MFNIVVFVFLSVTILSDAREGEGYGGISGIGSRKMAESSDNLNMDPYLEPTNAESYISSPFSLPPFDSLSPLPLPDTAPPFCLHPPFSSSTPTSPKSPPIFYSPPSYSPPEYEPPPPHHGVYSPPKHAPSPPKLVPSPPLFQTPVVLPPPSVPPPPPHKAPQYAVWCVAKPTVPDPIIQEAMDYACGSGADCDPIKPNGLCFHPNTLIAHASYAFNSYWQRTKVTGGTCDFGGTAMLVTVNPSFDDCHFIST